MISKKIRRHSGREYPSTTLKIPKQQIINNALEPQVRYNEWNNFRDGMRDWFNDFSKIKKFISTKHSFYDDLIQKIRKNNTKLKLKCKLRKVRKFMKIRVQK